MLRIVAIMLAGMVAHSRERTSKRINEIDGLRALAASLVLVFHVWGVGRISGGVDILILLSGFFFSLVIIKDGSVEFSKRVVGYLRRLLPLASIVLLVIVSLAVLDLAPKPQRTLLAEVVFSALMVENWYLAFQSRDYLAADGWLSMTQHFWAVSVQVQLFAGFFALTAIAERYFSGFGRKQLGLLLLGVSVASAVYSLAIASADPAFAYFDSFARAWQFGAGALIGMFAGGLPGWLRNLRFPFMTVGIVVILVTGLYVPPSLFPFPAGLVPVFGATFFIVGALQPKDSILKRLSRSRLSVFMGSLSYAIYLWHWPIMLLTAEMFVADPPTFVVRLLVVGGLSVVVAWLTTQMIETPLLRRSRETSLPKKVSLAAIPVAAVVAASLVVADFTERRDSERYAEILFPYESFRDVKRDNPDSYKDGCHLRRGDAEIEDCVYGDASGSKTVLLVGGSHAASWQPALHEAALDAGWTVVYATKSACRLTRAEMDSSRRDCEEWNSNVVELVKEMKPDLVVSTSTVTTTRGTESVPEGYRKMWDELSKLDTQFLMIRDVPRWPEDPVDCVEKFPNRFSELCVLEVSQSMAQSDPAQELSEEYPSFSFVDFTEHICPQGLCMARESRGFPFRDTHHLTKSFSDQLYFLFVEELRSRK